MTCRRRCWSRSMRAQPEVFRGARQPRASSRRASSSSPTSRRATAARRSSPATSACCARACATRSSSGTRTARRSLESRAARAGARSCSTPSSAPRAERVERMERSGRRARPATCRAPTVPWSERAALLAKADLVTGMVGEFPELQGVMGRYYARARGRAGGGGRGDPRPLRAAKAPTTPARPRPSSVVVALADKLDTLVGFFAVGNKPTGSKDPFALRRAGLGVIRLILENGLRLGLRQVFATALAGYGEPVPRRGGRRSRPGADFTSSPTGSRCISAIEACATTSWRPRSRSARRTISSG